MQISLRTVVYSSKVEIANVPVYICESCQQSEVYPIIKSDLTSLIKEIGQQIETTRIQFEDVHELVHLMVKATTKDGIDFPLENIVEERINELLDMMLLAQSLRDHAWVDTIRMKLRQITEHQLLVDGISR